jgi:hypothetical protein
MPAESSSQAQGADAKANNDDSAFVSDDSDVARIFSQVTGTTVSADLLERISGADRKSSHGR